MRLPSGLMAVLVPSALRMTFQPQVWMAMRWWNGHYADLLVMPTWWREPLVAGLGVAERSA
jgi:hypothetical protein